MKKYFQVSLLILATACHSVTDQPGSSTRDYIDRSAMDTAVRPQDNFFLYANGTWLKNVVIPPSQSGWGASYVLYDTAVSRMHFLLDSLSRLNNLTNNSSRQVADLYSSAMDSAQIERIGVKTLKPELDSIRAIRYNNTLIDEIAREFMVNHGPFFNLSVSPDEKNSGINIVHFDQGGLGMPNKDYYFKTDTSISRIREAYVAMAGDLFRLAGEDSVTARKNAKSVLALETALAAASKSPVQLRDPLGNYHKLAVGSLQKWWPSWNRLLGKLMIQSDTVLVGQPEFYKGLSHVLAVTPLPEIKNYLTFHVLYDDAPYLNHDFVNARFRYSSLLNGQKQMRERWKRMVDMVDEQLGDALGQIYVAKYFPPQAKERMNELVENLINTYAERIQQLDWMSDSTKQKALTKLHAIVKKIGYPDKWKDYSSIQTDKNDLIGNLRNTANYEYRRSISKIGKPVDRTEWFMTPPTVDAYYDPTQNNINFPAGILQPPFFYLDGDDAMNYGGIGLVIGHEITMDLMMKEGSLTRMVT